jgi:hypothetical protein
MENQSLENAIDILSSSLRQLANTNNDLGDLRQITNLNFVADGKGNNYGKGLIFTGHGNTKQLVLTGNPDRFFLSENLDLGKNKAYYVNNVKVLDGAELGASVTKSSLREIGSLRGLIVDGSVSINQFLYYDSNSKRFGVGTEEPNSTFSIVDKGMEIVIGADEKKKAVIGTYATHDFGIVSGNVTRITVKSSGAIDLGNFEHSPSQVRINGKLSVGVAVPDPAVDLHIAGAVRLNSRLQITAEAAPTSGSYSQGDIVWNSNPKPGSVIGWVCTRAGSPGTWNRFGEIR